MDKIVSVSNLRKSFGEEIKTEVLHGIDADFQRGAFTAIIGPSGSGKTTLLNIISLLEGPTSGKIDIDGNDFSEGTINDYAAYRNANIGFIFQFHHLLPEFTTLENILIPYWIGGGNPPNEFKKKALRLMEEVDILKIKDKYPSQISGGQQQRVAIARALVTEPSLLLADEPTGNLDEATGREIVELLFAGHEKRGTTLVLVTHDPALAQRCDRVVRLRSGRIVAKDAVA